MVTGGGIFWVLKKHTLIDSKSGTSSPLDKIDLSAIKSCLSFDDEQTKEGFFGYEIQSRGIETIPLKLTGGINCQGYKAVWKISNGEDEFIKIVVCYPTYQRASEFINKMNELTVKLDLLGLSRECEALCKLVENP